MLITFAQDPEPTVRARAAAGLAFLVAAERGGAVATDGLQRCLHDPGTAVPANIAVTLAEAPARSSVTQDALNSLCNHASAYVRATVQSAMR